MGAASSGEVEDYSIDIIEPTIVNLLGFSATPEEDGTVAVEWFTGGEFNTAGFNLLRHQEDSNGKLSTVVVNPNLIPAMAIGLSRTAYSLLDAPGYGTFSYQLQEVESGGRLNLYQASSIDIRPFLRISILGPTKAKIRLKTKERWTYTIEQRSLFSSNTDSWIPYANITHPQNSVPIAIDQSAPRVFRLSATPIKE